MTKTTYNADSIKSLDSHTHLLKRVALTMGSETGSSKHPYSSQKGVAIREVLDNALDEIRSGYGTHVSLAFYKDGSIEVKDSGRGLPVDSATDEDGRKLSGVHLCLGVIQSGGKFETDGDRFTSGLNGVGASSTVHLSKRVDVTVYRNNKKYELSFQDGTPGFFADADPESEFTELDDYSYLKTSKDTRPKEEKLNYPTGTTIRFWLRDSVFQSEYPFDHQDLVTRLRGTAFLVPQLYAEVYNELEMIEDPATGELVPQRENFHFDDGVLDLIKLNQVGEPLTPVLHFKTECHYVERNVSVLRDGKVASEDLKRRAPIELAFSYGQGYELSMHSYVNTIHTKLGGFHETALNRAMQKTFNEKFRSMRGLLTKADEDPTIEDFQEGLTAVLSIQVSEPVFTSQSKEQLSGRELQKAIMETLEREFEDWIKAPANNDALQVIAKKVVLASKNRQKSREQRDLRRKKTEISSASMPAKLKDCDLAGTDDAELYIAEGDSAIDSLKAARDGERHALLPVRGKVINAHIGTMKSVLSNTEVQDIIKTLGAGSGSDFDIEKMRYGRVFIAVDADPDGNAIACLIYALFWHLFKDVILQGRLFKVETPLFVFKVGTGSREKRMYARDDRERDKLIRQLDKKNTKYSVTRLKGLGEVDAEDLYISALNPETRVITQITVDDIDAALESLELILGKNADARKEWVRDSAATVDESLLE